MAALNLSVTPQEFFKDQISSAALNQKINLGDEIEFYLVNLLADFISNPKIAANNKEMDALKTPLAMILKEALELPPVEALRVFKYLGDSSLYVAGFFQDFFNRKSFDITYYMSIGASAYDRVSTLYRDHHREEKLYEIYADLADQFCDLVNIVAEVAEGSTPVNSKNILSIYERWTHTNSSRLLRVLEKEGIVPIKTNLRKAQ